jgi:hypothetical protein
MKELRVLAERWRFHRTVKPRSSLGYRSPARAAWLTESSQGRGNVESKDRFPLSQTPDYCDESYRLHALHLLVVHSHLPVEVQMQTPIAKAWMLTRQFPQPFLKLAVVSPAPIPATRSWHRHQLADVALAGLELGQQAPHFRFAAL